MCFTAIDRWKPCVFNVLIQTAAMTFDTVERQGGEIQERETERGEDRSEEIEAHRCITQ